jgi:D-alanine transaminase
MRETWTYFRSADLPSGGLMPRNRVCISPLDRGFLFADGVYEVIRSYSGRLFEFDRHLARLKRNLGEIRIPDQDLTLIAKMAPAVLRRNRLLDGDATVYVQVTRGIAGPRYHGFPDQPVLPTIYIEAARLEPRPGDAANGVAAITVKDIRWGRCDIKSIGLLLNVLARQQAIEAGVYEAIYVRNGRITEGTHTNICAVKSGTVFSHPQTRRILPGITLGVLLELLRRLGIPVREEPVRAAEMSRLDELFLVGTTMEVTGIVKVNGRAIGDGRPGPLTRRIQTAFRRYVSRIAGGKSDSPQRPQRTRGESEEKLSSPQRPRRTSGESGK